MVFRSEKVPRPITIANEVFSRVRKMIRPIRSHGGVRASRQNSLLFIGACSAAMQTFNKKSFSRSVLLVKINSEKHLGSWSGIVSFVSLSMKKL